MCVCMGGEDELNSESRSKHKMTNFIFFSAQIAQIIMWNYSGLFLLTFPSFCTGGVCCLLLLRDMTMLCWVWAEVVFEGSFFFK